MHKILPKVFIFLDRYDDRIFNNNNINIGIIYRNYIEKKREIELIKIAKACKKKKFRLFISNDIKLAIKFKAEGVYVPAFNKKKYFNNLENKKLIIIGSAHNQKEIKKKISQNCTAIFLSPVFKIKKKKENLGLHKFNYLSNQNSVKILALGGISKNNIKKLNLLNIKGFGGIEMFKKKPAYKRPAFLKNYFF